MKRFFNALILIVILQTIAGAQTKKLTIKDVTSNPAFRAKSLTGVKWIAGGSRFSFIKYDAVNRQNTITVHDAASGDEKVIFSSDDFDNDKHSGFSIYNYMWSPDEKYILFSGVLPARSLKSGGSFYIVNAADKSPVLFLESEEEQANVKFSPDSKMIGFVRGNNLYTAEIISGKVQQLTFDGNDNIINGKFDWVYEEEFSIIDGWEWSPDSRSIAFWRLDQTNVPDIQIAKWDSVNFNFHNMKYPKPGYPNSEVKIGCVNVADGTTTWMDLGSDKDIYIPRMKFTSDPKLLAVQKLSRLQNHLELLLFDVKTGKSNLVIDEKSDTWIDVYDDLTFIKKNNNFIWTSDKDGYKHLYLYNIKGKLISQLTKGTWEVLEVTAVDENKEIIYFMSNERGRRFKDLYSINFSGENKKRLTEDAGTHSVIMAANSGFYIDKYSNAAVPASTLLMNVNGKKIRTLIEADISPYAEYNLPTAEFFTFHTTDNVELDAFIVKPTDFDDSNKYPILIVQYNGPGSRSVTDSWGTPGLWEKMLTQQGFIIVGVDCRITAGKGSIHKKYAYRNLGYWEINDLTETVKYLRNQTYIDADNIGIWGWSYGGYTSALAILNAADYFKAAVAVAPVTDWRFYDNIYTERYMSTPALNPEGYEKSSVLNYTDNLKGSLLLIHGTGDDNVHFQNSVKLAEALIASNKQFSTMFYPEKDHGIYGGSTREHLFEMVTRFLLKNLKSEPAKENL